MRANRGERAARMEIKDARATVFALLTTTRGLTMEFECTKKQRWCREQCDFGLDGDDGIAERWFDY